MKSFKNLSQLPFKPASLTAMPRTARLPDAQAINDTIGKALAAAGLDTQTGGLKSAPQTIQRALAAAGLHPHAPPIADAAIIEGTARVVDQSVDVARGQFLHRSFTNDAGTRAYKLYIPARHGSAPDTRVPMVVMLHGCTQSPDDFATGTQMNALADQHGFLVVYPAQSPNANGSNCWNWFRPQDQQRACGEPSIIAGITRQVIANHHVDPDRVFVAGLSAGAAMAVILGATYPEVYAAVGAHSGLPHGAAHDMPSAFGAMQGQAGQRPANAPSQTGTHAPRTRRTGTPTIVFHGDQDHTVQASNGSAIASQAVDAWPGASRLRSTVCERATSGGRSYSRTLHSDEAHRVVVEEWLLHGAGHAWSGGDASGSFTDARGPCASREMVRFFHAHPRTASD